jgi:hypothetical protein
MSNTIKRVALSILSASALLAVSGTAMAQMTDKKSEAKPATGDGQVPAPTIDTNEDGKPDAWDRDANGVPDAWDVNGDGKPDVMDNNGDGKPDEDKKAPADKPAEPPR